MSIPNFKSIDDYQDYINLFRERWEVRLELLNSVRDDMFPGYNWVSLTPQNIEVINEIVQSLLYDTEYDFEQSHPDYKKDEDDIFVPRSSFKQTLEETLRKVLDETRS